VRVAYTVRPSESKRVAREVCMPGRSKLVAWCVGVLIAAGPAVASAIACWDAESFTASVVAASAGRVAAEDLRPVSSISSGGVSLGAYQAGRLHQWLNRRREAFAILRRELARCAPENPALEAEVRRALHPESIGVRVTVGASAGAISSVLIGLEACRDDDFVAPADSLLFLTWVAIGFENDTRLLDGTAAGSVKTPGLLEGLEGADKSLFNVASLDRVRAILASYLDPAARARRPDTWPELRFRARCEIGLGHTLMRTKSRMVRVASGQPVGKTLTDRLLITLATPDHAADTMTMSLDETALAHPRIKRSGRYMRIGGALDNLLASYQAAGAFPIAFPFVALQPEVPDGLACRNPVPGLAPPDALEGPDCAYLDGGGLNNSPLDIALDRLDIDDTVPKSPREFERPLFVFLDQDLTPFPPVGPKTSTKGATYFANLQHYANEAPEVVTTQQMAAGIQEALARESEQLDVRVIGRNSATFGEFLQSMSGFADARLRAADFLAGLRDTELDRPSPVDAARHALAAEVEGAYARASEITDPREFAAFRGLAFGRGGTDNGLDATHLPELVRVLGQHHRLRMKDAPARPAGTDELVENQRLIRESGARTIHRELFDEPSHAADRLRLFAEAQASGGDLVTTLLQVAGNDAFLSLLPTSDFGRHRLETISLPGLSALKFGLVGGFQGGFEVSVVAPGRSSLWAGFDTGFALTGFVGIGLADVLRLRTVVNGYSADRTRYDPGTELVPHMGLDVLPLRFFVWNPLSIPGLTLSLGGSWLRLDAGLLRPVRHGYGVLVDFTFFSRLYLSARYDVTTTGGLFTLGPHGGSIGIGYRF